MQALAMKPEKMNRTASEGLLYIEKVVNDHGSIFHRAHQESDVGIAGHIELVAETAPGKLVAVIVKSGDSYLADNAQEFSVSVEQGQLDYWCAYPVPVILVCYAPSMKIAAWTPVRQYVESEVYHGRAPVTSIRIPLSSELNVKTLNEGVAALADVSTDRRILIECVDMCLTEDPVQRSQGLSLLAAHPDARDSRTIADEALRTLAYHVGRSRWSGNPDNAEEKALIRYAANLCRDFTAPECRNLVERVDDEWFSGPDAMGERVLDLLLCCEASQGVMEAIARDTDQPMRRRMNALYLSFGCDDGELREARELADDPELGEIYRAIYSRHSGNGD
jgi:Domain of unknown function (DUF4365)